MKTVFFRCDASILIGTGHVMRCRTLARELQRKGHHITFLCRLQQGNLITLLEQEFNVLALPDLPIMDSSGLEGRDLYGSWLGCSQDQDASDCLAALSNFGITRADWIVVDHYGLDKDWEQLVLQGLSVNSATPKLLVIDDLADRKHLADLLLDQNFFGTNTLERYEGLVSDTCLQLLGPHYALLNDEYSHLHHLVPFRSHLKRILIFFGGVDSYNLTARTVEALTDPVFSDLTVDVVIGRHSPHRHEVEELVARRPLTNLYDNLPSLAGLIARADLSIGAGGVTTWERACLGLPSLVVPIASNQAPFVRALEQAGYIQYLCQPDNLSLTVIRAALLNKTKLLSLGVSAHSLVDGFGALRLVAAMFGFEDGIRIRPYLEKDSSLLHYWAKDNDFPSSTLQSDSVLLSESGQFDHNFLDDTSKQMIATTSDGCPIGCVRFLFSEADTLNKATKATISFTLDRCSHRHNLILKLIQLSFDYLHRHEDFSSQASTDSKSGIINFSSSFVRLSVPSEIQPSSNSSVSSVDNLSLSPSRITILSDRNSWFNSFIPNLVLSLWRRGHSVRCIHSPHQLQPGDVCLLLSCGSILKNHHLSLHRHNLVVHGSALPQGQGWSPVTWQILEGASSIPVTLFEAVDHLDAGPIYLQQTFTLEGHELVNDWRLYLARTTISLCLEWFDRYQVVVNSPKAQQGEPSYYTRRRPIDSELDPESSLATQFNLLRVVDNGSYPAFFHWRNQRYDLSIRLSKNSSRP